MSTEYKYNDEYDYNPVTDKFVKTGEPRKSSGYDPVWEKYQKELDIETKLKIKEAQQDALDSYKSRYEAEQKKQEYMRKQNEMKRKAEQAKFDAIDLARERYLEKSRLYRLFHKRLSDKRAAKMTTAEINKLYGGIEDEKGMSR